jgi:hypothetical protein
MPKIDSAARFKHAAGVSWRRVGDEGVLLDLQTSDYFSLNDVGVFIWEKLGLGASVQETEKALCNEYDVAPAEARRNVEAFIGRLRSQKLLVAR